MKNSALSLGFALYYGCRSFHINLPTVLKLLKKKENEKEIKKNRRINNTNDEEKTEIIEMC